MDPKYVLVIIHIQCSTTSIVYMYFFKKVQETKHFSEVTVFAVNSVGITGTLIL